jgi:putative phosphoesterase
MDQYILGIISDTHYPASRAHFPFDKIRQQFAGVTRILHAGDSTEQEVLDMLGTIAPVDAVCGNMDEAGLGLPETLILSFGRIRIGMVHGAVPFPRPQDIMRYYFHQEKIDIFVFGHTHRPFNESAGGVRYFNPGSPAKPAFSCRPSVGLLTVSDEGLVDARIVQI